MATYLDESAQDKPKSHVIFSKKPLEIDSALWNSLLQMEPQAVTKLALASLRKGVISRDKEDSTALLFFLKDIPIMQFFEKEFDTANLLQLITAMNYEHFKQGEEIVKQEGKIYNKVFFIVSGQCSKETVKNTEGFEDQNGQKTIKNDISKSQILAEKDTFGEEYINTSGDKIASSPAQTIRVLSGGLDCAVLNQELYFTLKKNLRQKREQTRMRLIRGCHIFQDRLTTKQATALSRYFAVRQFSCRQAVYNEGEIPKSIFLVKSGRFRITKKVKFDYHFENTAQIASKRTSLQIKEQNVAVLSEGGCFGDEEILRHLSSRVYSVFCESAEGELLEIKANDFFKVIAEEFTEDDLRTIEKLPSIQHNWREENAVSMVKIQRQYLEYLSEPPRQSDEAKNIFIRSISPLKKKRSIHSEVAVEISDKSKSPSPEKNIIQQDKQQYYGYYKGEDVEFLNDEQFCSSKKIEHIDVSSQDCSRIATLRKDSGLQMSKQQENPTKQLKYVIYADKKRSALGYLLENKVAGSGTIQRTSVSQSSTETPLSRELNQRKSIDNNSILNDSVSYNVNRNPIVLLPKINGSPIEQLSANRDTSILDQQYLHRDKLEDQMFYRLDKITKHPKNRSVSLSKNYCETSEKLNSSISKRYQNPSLLFNSNISQVESIYNCSNISYQTPPRITQNTKEHTIQTSPRTSRDQRNSKQPTHTHFSFQEIDIEDLKRRGILKKQKNSLQGNSTQLYQEAERGKRILDNYIVNFSIRKRGSEGVQENRRLFEDEILNQLNDSKGFVIRGIHKSNSPKKIEKDRSSALRSIHTDQQTIRNSNSIKKDKVLLKSLNPQ